VVSGRAREEREVEELDGGNKGAQIKSNGAPRRGNLG